MFLGISRPRSLTVDEFQRFIAHMAEPFPHDGSNMRLLRPSHLRVSCAEMSDVDWLNGLLRTELHEAEDFLKFAARN
jgi:hypothetical protein